MVTITVVSPHLDRPEISELLNLEANDQYVRASLFARVLNSDMLDERFVRRAPIARRLLYKPLPRIVSHLLEAIIVKDRYDAIISWSEHVGLPLAMLLKLTGSRIPNVILASWISKPKKAMLMKFASSHIDRLVLMSSVQRDFAVNVLHMPSSKVVLLKWPVDQKFWRPMDCQTDMICAVGAEMRDYPTLIEAIRGLDIRCHIAAGTQRFVQHCTVKAVQKASRLPTNITVGRRTFTELRALYARSRFVVIPLLPSDTDNGSTSILEAMAMGKAVICTRTKGQVDVVQDGTTGILVPPGDSKAMREAIQHLWEHPDEAEKMGRAGREYVEENHTLDEFVGRVRELVEAAIDERRKLLASMGTHPKAVKSSSIKTTKQKHAWPQKN
jgi:glycosyltransferase involved in cell wall biosynthesis